MLSVGQSNVLKGALLVSLVGLLPGCGSKYVGRQLLSSASPESFDSISEHDGVRVAVGELDDEQIKELFDGRGRKLQHRRKGRTCKATGSQKVDVRAYHVRLKNNGTMAKEVSPHKDYARVLNAQEILESSYYGAVESTGNYGHVVPAYYATGATAVGLLASIPAFVACPLALLALPAVVPISWGINYLCSWPFGLVADACLSKDSNRNLERMLTEMVLEPELLLAPGQKVDRVLVTVDAKNHYPALAISDVGAPQESGTVLALGGVSWDDDVELTV